MSGRTIDITLLDGMHFTSAGEDGVEIHLDSSPSFGGGGKGWRPMELMLVSLGSCTGMDVLSILRKKRMAVDAYSIQISGTQASDYPHVFTEIAIRHLVEGPNVTEEAVRRAIQLSEEKYCPAYAMLSKVTAITTSFEVRGQPPRD